MITLPAYPKEIELYTPPPPLPFCDNFQKYNGTIFWGLLPIEIEEKILKMVVNINQKDIKDEFTFLYRYVNWETEEWQNGYREIVRDLHKKLSKSYSDRRMVNNKIHLGITKLNRTLSITENSKPFSYNNKCIHQKFLNWKHDMVWGSLLSGDKMEGHSIGGGSKLQLSWKCERPIAWRFERGGNDKLNYENSTVEDRRRDRLNMYSNSKLVMSINMNSTLTDLKTYIKDNLHKNQIKHHFGGLSKYKNDNKNELIKKIYSFNEDKYKWVVKK
jgi:hypothetical protein